MSTVDDIFTRSNAGLANPVQGQQNKLGQDDFLELMITQLRNQDPLKPMESGEFLSQIAQFSTVTGIKDLQSSFASLAGSIYSNQALQASGLVGRAVLVPSSHARLPAGGMLEGAVDLPVGTQDLVIGIYNGSNELVRAVHLGRQTAGVVSFAWDGTDETGGFAPPGVYELRATAGGASESRALDTLAKSRVNSVSLGGQGGGISLNLDGLGEVDFAQVREIM